MSKLGRAAVIAVLASMPGPIQAQLIDRIIANDGLTEGNDSAWGPPAMSANGQFVVFTSLAGNLLGPGIDTNGHEDVFVTNLQFGTTERVSVSDSGVQGNGKSGHLVNPVRSDIGISDDGNRVTFTSVATNLIDCAVGSPADCGSAGRDLFLHNRQTSTTKLMNVSEITGPGNGTSPPVTEGAAISGDGQYVAFIAGNIQLVNGDADEFGPGEVYLKPTFFGGALIRASVDLMPDQGIQASGSLSLSDDGNRLVYTSLNSTLVAGDANNQHDVFMFQRTGGAITRVSVADDEAEANGPSRNPVISGDGRYVAFWSSASNLTPPTPDVGGGIYIRDLVAGTTIEVVGTGCVPPPALGCTQGSLVSRLSISDDGRFVAFDYTGKDLFWPADSNQAADVYLYDRVLNQVNRISVDTEGGDPGTELQPASAVTPGISGDGSVVAFTSFAVDLVPDDENNRADVFVGGPQVVVPIQAVLNRAPRGDGLPGWALVGKKHLVVRVFARLPRRYGAPLAAAGSLCIDGQVPTCPAGKLFQATGQALTFGAQLSDQDRRNGSDSLNFFVVGDAADTLLTAGVHQFEIRIGPQTPGEFPEIVRSFAAHFSRSRSIDFNFFKVFVPNSQDMLVEPTSAFIEVGGDLVGETFPVDESVARTIVRPPEAFTELPESNPNFENKALAKLVKQLSDWLAAHQETATGEVAVAVGVLPALVDGVQPMSRSGFSFDGVPDAVLTIESLGPADLILSTTAHEVGHLFGLGEEYCLDQTLGEFVLETPCQVDGVLYLDVNPPPQNQEEGDEAGNYIREEDLAFDVTELVENRKAIFDSSLGHYRGYMGVGTFVDNWTKAIEYAYLYPLTTEPPGGGGVAPRLAVVRPLIYLSGLIQQNGTVVLSPLVFLSTDKPLPTPKPGSAYAVDFLDDQDQVIGTQSFDIPFTRESHDDEEAGVMIVDEVPFALYLDLPAGAETVRLRKGATTIAERSKSANAPTVAFTSVVAQAGNVLDLEWMGSDLDGDDLTYTLFYSPDGVDLQPLAVNLDATELSLDLDEVPAISFGAFVRVRASDGWSTGEDDHGLGPAFAVLDVDADGEVQPLSDGLLLVRHLFGFTGPTLTGGALGEGCTRCLAADITDYLDGIEAQLDVDDNGGAPQALTDGLLVLRHLFGFTGAALIGGALGDGCMLCDPALITTYLDGLDG